MSPVFILSCIYPGCVGGDDDDTAQVATLSSSASAPDSRGVEHHNKLYRMAHCSHANTSVSFSTSSFTTYKDYK